MHGLATWFAFAVEHLVPADLPRLQRVGRRNSVVSQQVDAIYLLFEAPRTEAIRMSRVYSELKQYINLGLTLTVAASSALFARSDLAEVYASDPYLAGASAALLVATVARFLLYWLAVQREVELLNEALTSHKVDRVEGQAFLLTIMVALAFAFLITSSTNIMVYTSLAVAFAFFDLVGPITVNRNLARLVFAQNVGAAPMPPRLIVLVRYYLVQPLVLRVAVMLLAACSAFAFALVWTLTNASLYQYLAYGISIASIVIGEVVIFRWRQVRDSELNTASTELEGATDGGPVA